jgi:HSP20 family protein
MTLVRWSPFLSRWPSIWDEDDFPGFSSGANNLDVYETEDEVVVKANVAGVKPDDVEVTFEKGVLYIKDDKTVESEDKERKHYSKSTSSYSYRVSVPGLIDHGKEPSAEVEDGILTIKFSKSEASKPKRLQIRAKSGK